MRVSGGDDANTQSRPQPASLRRVRNTIGRHQRSGAEAYVGPNRSGAIGELHSTFDCSTRGTSDGCSETWDTLPSQLHSESSNRANPASPLASYQAPKSISIDGNSVKHRAAVEHRAAAK